MLFQPHDVADRVFIGLVVGVIPLRTPHGLFQDRVREAALDSDNDGLVLLVAHHGALQHPLRHLGSPHFDFSAARFCAAMVLTRAMSRRTSRTRPVFSSCPVARWKRRLNCSFLSFINSSESWSGVIALASPAFIALLRDALYEARLDRQLGGRERERLLGELDGHTVELEQDAAGLYARDPQLDAALARAHAHFERLLGD